MHRLAFILKTSSGCCWLSIAFAKAALALGELMITEVDYDQPGGDTAEWIEIYNTQDYGYPLAGVSVVLYDGDVHGSCEEYCRVDLSPLVLLGANQYLVIGAHPYAPLPLCTTLDAIQDGTPDVITIEEYGEVMDSVEYESGLTYGVCPQVLDWTLTSAADSDSEPGSLQLFCPWEWFASWRFLAPPTPRAPTPCTATDVPPFSEGISWAGIKSLYRDANR